MKKISLITLFVGFLMALVFFTSQAPEEKPCPKQWLTPELVNLGKPNAANGDPLRTAFSKSNYNDELIFQSVNDLNTRIESLEYSVQQLLSVPNFKNKRIERKYYRLMRRANNLTGK